MTEQWADYSQVVGVDQLDAALRAGGFTGVLHYFGGDDARRVEDPSVVAGIAALGWPQAGIFVPARPSSVDGAADAGRARQVYAHPTGDRLYLDVEPAVFVLDPTGWAAAATRWCAAVRAAGYSPGGYGTDETIAACFTTADTIWRATPGQCDPAGPGLADTFFPGRRAAQCNKGTWAGVEMDLSLSQYALEVAMTPGQIEEAVDTWYWTMLGRSVESDAARQGWAGRVLPDGSNLRLVRDQFAETDEAQAYAKVIAALKGGTLPPAPMAPHIHPVTTSGTTGQAQ